MTDDLALMVELEDSAVLYGTPCGVLIAGGDGGDACAYTVVLGGKTALVEDFLVVVDKI